MTKAQCAVFNYELLIPTLSYGPTDATG